MSKPTKEETHGYRFSDDITFFQKAVILHPHEDKILVVKRSETDNFRPDTWDLPGGNIFYGELHIDGLRREILEETGLEVEELRVVHLITQYDKTIPMYYIVTGFLTKAKNADVRVSHEHSAFQWVTRDDFLKMDPQYVFTQERPFDQNSTNFLRDIVSLAFR
jgi:8-oxo-dGTP pyrophosphatase MutT (NUDIX family)